MGKSKVLRQAHRHGWIFGVIGLLAGGFLMVFVPSLTPVANSLFLFAGFHIVGAIVILATLWYGGLRDHFRHTSPLTPQLNFGWDRGWTVGLAIAALIATAFAVVLQVSAPEWWILACGMLLMGASWGVGFILMSGYRHADHAVLPMVDLLSGDSDVVLDAGCGAGRTTLALAGALRHGRIVAFDRFDAAYIEDGGRALLEHNLTLAGLKDRVQIETGDLAVLPFMDASFNSVVSTNVYDHLGSQRDQAMRETFRVMVPGGRFLLGISVWSWAMFAVASFLSFVVLSRRRTWRKLAERIGFTVDGEWMVNGTWFVLLRKPERIA